MILVAKKAKASAYECWMAVKMMMSLSLILLLTAAAQDIQEHTTEDDAQVFNIF